MASLGNDPAALMSSLLTNLLCKDEIWSISQYKSGCNINKHLSIVEDKIKQLQLDEKRKCDFLLKTLSQDVFYELSSLAEFDQQRYCYDWIVKSLIALFGQKESKISAYMDLCRIQQQPNQTTREFLSSIRVSAQKNLHCKTQSEKEDIMVLAFINGLKNKAASRILNELKPQSLEEAFQLVKKEKVNEEDEHQLCLQIKEEEKQKHCQCLEKIELLTARIRELERRISSQNSRLPQTNRQLQTNQRRCWNCNLIGHTARNCRKSPTCRTCGKIGHITENCRMRNSNKVRRIANDQESVTSEPASDIIMQDGESSFNDTNEQPPRCMSIQKSTKRQRPQKKCATIVDSWVQYIDGNGKKPKKKLYSETVISTSNPEKARGKPVIAGTICKSNKNMLLDTGSESNVIDYCLLKELAKSDQSVKFYERQGKLTCANGSGLGIVGYAMVTLNIAGKSFVVKFTVANQIFPRIILGTRFLRLAQMSVDVAKQRALMWNSSNSTQITIPFLSVSRDQGN